MDATLLTSDGSRRTPDPPTIQALLKDGTEFWLDLLYPGQNTHEVLSTIFQFHPLAVEDADHFGQRPKLDHYENYIVLVVYGATADAEKPLVEVHCFYSEQYLVTVHHEPVAALQRFAERVEQRALSRYAPIMLLHGVLDGLVDSFFPVLAELDDEIDTLEDQILERPTQAQLGRLFDMKRSLLAMRKAITPERDTLASAFAGIGGLPGMNPEAEPYFRDVYDHLIRISDLVDSYRDLMSGVLDTHLSTVSNRLNAVMKQLTIIATLFLPLSFLTGFFGQNFDVLVASISGWPAFLIFGIGLEALALVCLLVMFWRRGWLSG